MNKHNPGTLGIGSLITFKIPALNGSRTVAGTILRIFRDGRVEVKTQNDGYYVLDVEDSVEGKAYLSKKGEV